MTEDDRYIVYHAVIPSMHLAEQQAKQAGLLRSPLYGVVHIAVHRKHPDGRRQPVSVWVKGSVRTGSGSTLSLGFQFLRQGDYVSYAAPFLIAARQAMTFDIQIETAADHPGFRLGFTQTLDNGDPA